MSCLVRWVAYVVLHDASDCTMVLRYSARTVYLVLANLLLTSYLQLQTGLRVTCVGIWSSDQGRDEKWPASAGFENVLSEVVRSPSVEFSRSSKFELPVSCSPSTQYSLFLQY